MIIKTSSPLSTRLRKKLPLISLMLLQKRKEVYQRTKLQRNPKKTILFIIGCQRSGTTLMTRVFERDFNTKVYGEFSKLSSHDTSEKLRLNSLESVKRVIERNRAPLVILKPLVETQNSPKLLSYFKDSKALWLYRHYKDVASSNLKNFGIRNGIDDLRPMVENQPQNWRSERISESVREVVLERFSEDMDPHDAAALFWYVRNSLFFELNLHKHPDVMMCRYEDLVADPLKILKRIYSFVDHDFPGEKIISEAHNESLGKGKSITLSPEIDHLCGELLEKLDEVYQTKNYRVE